jgi:hypothetical protein
MSVVVLPKTGSRTTKIGVCPVRSHSKCSDVPCSFFSRVDLNLFAIVPMVSGPTHIKTVTMPAVKRFADIASASEHRVRSRCKSRYCAICVLLLAYTEYTPA